MMAPKSESFVKILKHRHAHSFCVVRVQFSLCDLTLTSAIFVNITLSAESSEKQPAECAERKMKLETITLPHFHLLSKICFLLSVITVFHYCFSGFLHPSLFAFSFLFFSCFSTVSFLKMPAPCFKIAWHSADWISNLGTFVKQLSCRMKILDYRPALSSIERVCECPSPSSSIIPNSVFSSLLFCQIFPEACSVYTHSCYSMMRAAGIQVECVYECPWTESRFLVMRSFSFLG